MKYTNPVLLGDYSDPDIIRAGQYFYMVSSSCNQVPGVPVLHSENLVEWRLINHVIKKIPFDGYDTVRHGEGAGAPSIRFHNGKFYCLIPFYGEGIYVSEADDPAGEWSPLRPLVEGVGLKDPCPIWENGRCYIVFAFDSRAGVHSQLAVFEANEELTAASGKYTVIYDGHNMSPLIGSPKVYRRGKYFYILAAAGGVSSGWQVALRSASLYGPFESRIILMQGSTDINGPHSGALVDVDGEKWAFMHSQDMGGYGKVLHLQPVLWSDDWPLCGNVVDTKLPAIPAQEGDYPVDIHTDYALTPSDEFDGESISDIWHNPANPADGWAEMKKGLRLNCVFHGASALSDLPQMFLQNVPYLNFSVKTKCRLNLVNDGDEAGFAVFGKEYAYICVVRRDGRNYLEIREGKIGGSCDETLCQSQPYDDNYVTFQTSAKYEDRNKLTYKFTFGGSAFTHKFYASAGVNSGAKIGIYARSNTISKGCAAFRFFRVVCTDSRLRNGSGKP